MASCSVGPSAFRWPIGSSSHPTRQVLLLSLSWGHLTPLYHLLFIYRVFTDFTDLRVARLEKYPKRLVPLLELLLLLRELSESIFASFAEEPLFCVKSLFWARTQWINCCNGDEMRVNLAISCRFLGGLEKSALLVACTAKSSAPLTLLYSSADETCLVDRKKNQSD